MPQGSHTILVGLLGVITVIGLLASATPFAHRQPNPTAATIQPNGNVDRAASTTSSVSSVVDRQAAASRARSLVNASTPTTYTPGLFASLSSDRGLVLGTSTAIAMPAPVPATDTGRASALLATLAEVAQSLTARTTTVSARAADNLSNSFYDLKVTDAQVPDDITVSNYLPLTGGTITGDLSITGNFTVSGTQSLSGAITVPYLVASSSTATNSFAGAVGIGTSSPFAKLSVAGSTYLGGNLTATGTVQFTNYTNGALAADATGNLYTFSTSTWTFASSTLFADNNTFSGQNIFSGAMTTFSNGISVAGASGLTVLSSGKVGIGTTSPAAKLSVVGNSYFAGAVLTTSTVQLTNYVGGGLATDASGNLYTFATSTWTFASSTLLADNSIFTGQNSFSGATTTLTNGFSAASDLFNVFSNGNVGICTTLPCSASGTTISPTDGIKSPTVENVILVVAGDSISAPPSDCPSCGRINWPYQMAALSSLWGRGTLYNYAVGGNTVQAMVGQYVTQAHTVRPTNPNDVGYFFLRGGVNDIGGGRTAAQVYADLKTVWASARSDGYKVVAFVPSGVGSQLGVVTPGSLAALIIGDPTQYDYLVRDDLALPDPNDTTLFFNDGLHPNPYGSARTAKAVAEVLNSQPITQKFEELWNGGFEIAGASTIWAGWAADAGVTDTTVSAEVHSGSHAAKVPTWDVLGSNQYQFGALVPGNTYTLSFWTRGDGTNAAQYYIYGNVGGYIVPLTSTGITGTSYQYISKSFIAPAGVTSMAFALVGPPSAGYAFFDDVSFRENNPGVTVSGTSGNVGIGTTSPATLLEIGGFTANVTLGGYLNCAGFTSNANGLLTCTASDERLKQEVTPLSASSTLAALNALNPVSFYWKPGTERGSAEQFGLIAQDVQQIFPNLVTTSSPTALTPDGTLSINYDGLIAPIIKAIQEMTAIQSVFKANLIAWLGNAGNGILNIFAATVTADNVVAHQVTADELCARKADGTPMCVTGDQLQAVFGQSPGASTGGSVSSSNGGTVTVSASSTPATNATSSPTVVGGTDPEGVAATSTDAVVVEAANDNSPAATSAPDTAGNATTTL